MTIHFSRQGLEGWERRMERFLEVVPGATSWALLIGMLALAFWRPLLAAVLIIAFDLYWLLRLFYMTLFLVLSYLRLSMERTTDWMARVEGMSPLEPCLEACRRKPRSSDLGRRVSDWLHVRELEALARSGSRPPPAEEIYHVVIVPIIKEPEAVYEPGIRRLCEQRFPAARMLVVLAVEERAEPAIQEGARAVQERYRGRFLEFLVVVHPDGLPGEARVKGANATCAAKAAAQFLAERGIPFERVVVSCFDADTVVSPQYFAALTYHFMACPTRTRASFQPIPVYHNNIWDVPGFARVLDVGASFFQLIEATNPEKLVTFSSHSMSFQALAEVGYWPVDMISDDSAIFWKAFLHYDGDYRVVPLYVTVSMDVAASDTWRKTVLNVYRQKRRWAWGVENFPIVLRAFLRSSRIPVATRIKHAFKLFEGHIAWATWPLLLGIISWLPALLANREFSSTVVYYNTPRITFTIFDLASIGLVTTILLSLCLLPTPPAKRAWLKAGHLFEWLLVPITAIALSAVPALDAQTRLLFGRYLEFWVTEKRR